MITRLVSETRELLSSNKPLLQELSVKLAATGNLTAAEVAAIGIKYGVPAVVKAEGFLEVPDYDRFLSTLPSAPEDKL
jgi:hypothetical protein